MAGLFALLGRVGWLYGLGIMLAMGALFGFGELAEEVLEGDIQPINVAVLRILHAYSNPRLDRLALALTELGGVVGTTVIACLAGVFFVWRRRFFDAVTLALVVLGGGALMFGLKLAFRQPRPDLFESMVPAHGFAFPSGHALMSVCLYGYLAAILVLDEPKRWWRWCGAAALGLLTLGIIWSRLYLGVHWLSDVAGGGFVALFWLTCCVLAGRYADARLERGREEPPQADQVGAQTQEPESLGLLRRWKGRARELKREAYALYLACRDPRTPWYAKLTAACVVAYAFSPIDLIPDFIPILGLLDEGLPFLGANPRVFKAFRPRSSDYADW